MRRSEPLEPAVGRALTAIDATLRGEPVAPELAGLAELALILRAERPVPAADVASAIDERVAQRLRRPPRRRRMRLTRGWLAAPVAAVAAVALVVLIVSGGGGGTSPVDRNAPSSAATSASASAGAASPASSAHSTASAASAASSADSTTSAASQAVPIHPAVKQPAPAPSPSGKRQVVQSAQLALSTAPSRIDDVAQQVFDVVDSEKGIVVSSHVTSTGGPDAGARFALSVPVANLRTTVSDLSQLHGAHVVSRSDDTSDITGQVGGAGRRLAEARALRRSLLRQLADAGSPEAVASLRAQLHDADAAIGRGAASLNALHRSVADSGLTVTIQAAAGALTTGSRTGGFTLDRAVHDAGRVLVVVAGVALIALAVLVPLGLLGAVVAWAGLLLRRRRREALLDLM